MSAEQKAYDQHSRHDVAKTPVDTCLQIHRWKAHWLANFSREDFMTKEGNEPHPRCRAGARYRSGAWQNRRGLHSKAASCTRLLGKPAANMWMMKHDQHNAKGMPHSVRLRGIAVNHSPLARQARLQGALWRSQAVQATRPVTRRALLAALHGHT